MITQWFVSMLGSLASGVFGLVPSSWSPPPWLTDQSSTISGFIQNAGGLSTWVPIGLTVTILLAVLSSYGIGILIRVTRTIISHVTGGGGAT